MIKYFKYVLAVAILVVACATFALAADGEVVATVNGQPFESVEAAFQSASAGSRIEIVKNTTLDTLLTTPAGVTLNIPRGVRVTLDNVGFNLYNSKMSISGDIIRLGSTDYGAISVQQNSQLDLYGGIVTASQGNCGIFCTTVTNSENAVVNVFGGRIEGFDYSIRTNSSWGGHVNVYGGEFVPNLVLGNHISLANGANFVDGSNNSIVSWGGLYEIGRLVASGVSWISLFCAAIIANKLLLIFVIFFMGFAGIGLIRRIIR